jgi:hypothetical protein
MAAFLAKETPTATAPIKRTAKPIRIRFMYALKRTDKIGFTEGYAPEG